MKNKTDERNKPKAGKCSKCGETVGVGWGHAQHMKICRKVRPAKLDNNPATTNGFHTPAAPNTLTDASGDTDNACGGDVLAAAGETPMTAYTKGEDNTFNLIQKQSPIAPTIMGVGQKLNMANHTGLPKWFSIDERRGMRLAIAKANAIQNKSISWTEPVQTYTEMKLTLENRQQRHGSSERLVKVTLFTYASCNVMQCHFL